MWFNKATTELLIREYTRISKVDINEFYDYGNALNREYHHIENELIERLGQDDFNKLWLKIHN